MHQKYVRGVHPLIADGSRGSPTWRRLCSVREAAEEHIFWRLGSGLLDFWTDKWAMDEPLAPFAIVENPPFFFFAEFFQGNGWNVGRLRQWLPSNIVALITEIYVQPHLNDAMIWSASSHGCFTSDSAYDLVRQRKPSSNVARVIWNPVLPLKISFLAWRVANRLLPVDDLLQHRGLPLVSKCSCCFSVESVRHLFFEGAVAQQVWGYFFTYFGLQVYPHTCLSSMVMQWSFSSPRGSLSHARCLIPIVVIWFMWRARNEARFQGLPMHAEKILYNIRSSITSTLC